MDRVSQICVFLAIFYAAFHQANGLRCYTCKTPDIRGCPGLTNVAETNCDPAQDVCFKFEGDVVKDNVPAKNLTTKSCVAYSVMQQYSGGYSFQKNGCITVNSAKDPNQNQFYTGRICLCNDKDFCNAASFKSTSVVAVMIGLCAAVWFKFV